MVTTAVAVAVVPTPTGSANLIAMFPEYPEPAVPIVNAVIEPRPETVAVAAAPTPIFPEVINASTLPSPL